MIHLDQEHEAAVADGSLDFVLKFLEGCGRIEELVESGFSDARPEVGEYVVEAEGTLV